MPEYIFGSGTVVGVRTDVSGQQPAFFGTLQDITLDFSRKIESLVGQYMSPVAFAGGELTITGKAKMGRFQAAFMNNMFWGQTLTSNAGIEMAVAEAGTPSAGSYQVQNHSTFGQDLGVFYAATGAQLTPVSTAPAQGQYEVSPTGSYTFNTADNNQALLFYYNYTVSTEQQLSITNQLMGPVTSFSLFLKESFTYFGTPKNFNLKLNFCVSEKLTLGFTNTKFSIPELDFMAGADQGNNIGTISLTD